MLDDKTGAENYATQMCRIGGAEFKYKHGVGIIGGGVGKTALTEALGLSLKMEQPLIIEDFSKCLKLPKDYSVSDLNFDTIVLDYYLPDVKYNKTYISRESNWFNEHKHKQTCAKNRKKRKRLKRSKK